jgi:hypothetical protein
MLNVKRLNSSPIGSIRIAAIALSNVNMLAVTKVKGFSRIYSLRIEGCPTPPLFYP